MLQIPFSGDAESTEPLRRCIKRAANEMNVSEFHVALLMSHFVEELSHQVANNRVVRVPGFGRVRSEGLAAAQSPRRAALRVPGLQRVRGAAQPRAQGRTTLIHAERLVSESQARDPEHVLPPEALEGITTSRHLPFIQTVQNVTSRYGTWRIKRDQEDPTNKVNILFGEPRKAFNVPSPLDEAIQLMQSIADAYPGLDAEFDTTAEQVLNDCAHDHGTIDAASITPFRDSREGVTGSVQVRKTA